MPVSIAIIVPAYNSEETLSACLTSILNLNKNNYQCGIYVVDNGSTDNTSAIARKMGVEVLLCKERGRSQARNFGVNKTSSELIAFVDSDIILDKDWLINLVPLLNPLQIAAVLGPIVPGPAGKFVDDFRFWRKKLQTGGTFVLLESPELSKPIIDTAACLLRRSAFEQSGGFDETLERNEDRELTWRMVEKGYSLRSSLKSPALKLETRGWIAVLLTGYVDGKTLLQMEIKISGKDKWNYVLPYLKLPYLFELSGPVKFRIFNFLYRCSFNIGICAGVIAYRGPTDLKVKWNQSKLNLLLPAINFNGKTYVFSASKRFALNEKSLSFYGFAERARLPFFEEGMVKFFESYLKGEISEAVSSQYKKYIEKLIEAKIFTEV